MLKKEIVLNSKNMPRHIALIMDGNGRWAKNRGLERSLGHKAGASRISDIVKEAIELDIKAITIYAFSSENWKREKKEIDYLFSLALDLFDKKIESVMNKNIKIKVIGDLSKFNNEYVLLKNKIEEVIYKTRNNTGLILTIALNYGSHNEIIEGIKKISRDVKNNLLEINDINEETFNKYLMTYDLPPLDLLIRTSGEKRLSNFLLYQLAYTELVFTNVYWPDFTAYEFRKCIYEYQKRDRKFGNIK